MNQELLRKIEELRATLIMIAHEAISTEMALRSMLEEVENDGTV